MAIALGTYKSSYYIKPSQVTLMANDQNNPSLVYVGVRSGTYVEIYFTDRTGATPVQVIGYGPNSSYQKWQLSGSSTKLASNAKHYIYIRLRRTEKTAMLIFSTRLYDFYGENPDGVNHAANRNLYYYILAGELTATDGTSSRELTFQTGNLSTPENSYDKEEADSKFMSFAIADQRYLNQVEDDTAKGVITFLQGIKIGSWEGENTSHSFQLRYDETLDSVVLSRTDGKPAHFLATGALSTRGLGEIEEGGGGTGTGVDLLNIPSDIIPSVGGSYNLGSSERAWKMIYANGGAIGSLGLYESGVLANGYIKSINSSWLINPDGSATFSSLTINGANAATQNWVNSQLSSYATTSALSSYATNEALNSESGARRGSTLSGAQLPNGQGYSVTWQTSQAGAQTVKIPTFGSLGYESIDDYYNKNGLESFLVDGVLMDSLLIYIEDAISAGGNVDLSNYVTLNSAQTISGKKTFTGGITVQNGITASHLYSVEYLDSSELTINAEKVTLTYDGDDANLSVGLLNGYKPLTLGNTSFSPALTSGTVIGTITIGGESKTIYAPNGGSVDLSNYVTLDGEQTITGAKTFSNLNSNSIFLQGFELKPYSPDGGTPDRLKYDGYVLLDEYNYSEYLDSAYVKKSGDTVTGQLGFSSSDGKAHIVGNNSQGGLILAKSSSSSVKYYLADINFRPSLTNISSLGGVATRWSNVYSVLGDFSGQITSSVADGTAPFVVASKTEVANLHSATATKLHTARTLWGQSFDGSGNVSGNLTEVGSITASNLLTLSSTGHDIYIKRGGADTAALYLGTANFRPFAAANGLLDLGASNARWKVIYGQSLDLSGDATVRGVLRLRSATPSFYCYYNNATMATTLIQEVAAGTLKFSGNTSTTDYFKLFLNMTDATIKFYSMDNEGYTYGNEMAVIQTCFDGQDPETSGHVTQHEARCNLLLQPRGGQVYVGYTPTDVQSKYSLNVHRKMKLYGISSDNPEVLFYRDGESSWKVINSGGNLIFQNNYTTAVQSSYFDVFKLNYNTGNADLKGSLTTGGNILPSVTNTLNLGQPAKRWNVYAASLSAISVTSSLTPDAVDSRDLGSIALPWYCGYIDYLSPKEIWFNDDEAYAMRVENSSLVVTSKLAAPSIMTDELSSSTSRYISVNAMSLDLYECELYGYNSDNLDVWNIDFAGNAYFLSVTQTSDVRYKNIKENIHLELSDIAAAPTFKFSWANETDGSTHIGTSAQYWQEIAGELVTENKKTGKLGLDYSTAALVSAVSIAREVNTMKMWQTSTTDRIEELEDKVKKLEEENKALRELNNEIWQS